MASSGTVCEYESYFTPSNLMYSKLSTHVNWTDYGKGARDRSRSSRMGLLNTLLAVWTELLRFTMYIGKN